MKKKRLGHGVEALFNIDDMSRFNSTVNERGELVVNIPLSHIIANPNQPRKTFDEESIRALAVSIEKVGLLQPISVVSENGKYIVVAGERRLRAVKSLGQETIKAIVVNADERLVAELALIENLQREDLNPVDEAEAYLSLTKTHSLTHEQISDLVGKSRAHISNFIRLLTLQDLELEALKDGSLSVGHAKVLLGIKDKGLRARLFDRILQEKISVRDAEKFAQDKTQKQEPEKSSTLNKKNASPEDPDKTRVERTLSDCLGRKVSITSKNGERGVVTLEFYNKEDRDRLLDLLFHVEQ